ncbi:MAG TPA: carboxypeptidase regulatory-like domain-containing protein, partial [Terracidiphilus sp.]|nr:carboxypeptidase regulatory-like domain-containing protein [Terracidiphilus sp.]
MHQLTPRVVSVFLAALCLVSGSFAQGGPAQITVQGSVSGPDGKPIADARVDVRAGTSNTDSVADTVTDIDGKFALLGIELAPGSYLIHASAPGFGEAEKTFKVGPPTLAKDVTFDLALPPQPKERGASSGFTVVRVLYATDRKARTTQRSLQYVGQRSDTGSLSYGSCEISIPESHVLAGVERPDVWKLEFHPDPEKHILLQRIDSEAKAQFMSDVAGMVAASPDKEAFVFIHGYNVSFE